MTRRALSLLLNWASKQRPGSQVGGLNVLCCDFVDASQFCSLVIGLNYKLLDPAEADVRGKNRWVHFFPTSAVSRFFSGDLSIPRPRWCNYPHWAERGAAGRLFWALPSMQGVKMPPCRSLCRCVMTEASSAFYIFPCITQNCLVIWHFHDLIVYFPRN